MDVTTLADALAPVLRDLVDETVAPLVARLETTERQLADAREALKDLADLKALADLRQDLETLFGTVTTGLEGLGKTVDGLPKVPTAEEVAALVPPAENGKDADPEFIRATVAEQIAALPKAVDGTSVTIDDVRPLIDEVVAAKVAEIPAPKDGNDADPEVIRAMVTEVVEALPKAKDGESVTIDDVRPLVDEVVAAKVAEIPPAKDGKDVDLDVVRNLITDEVRVQVADLPVPENGKDASPEAIAAEVEKVLATWERPKDGKDVDQEAIKVLVKDGLDVVKANSDKALSLVPTAQEVAALVPREVIAEAVSKELATWERPKDGKSVTVDEVMPLLQERLDKAVAALPAAKDGVGLAGALIDSDGVLVVTLTDGGLHKLGPVRGADGLGDGDFELVDGPSEFTVRLVRGDLVKEWKIAKPTLADMHQGIWHEGAYKRGAVVTWGGSQWLAVADTEARPETTKDWVLVVKRGRDGKDLLPTEPKPPAKVKLR